MNYLKSLFFNFLVIFFADYILPGISVESQTKLPHVGWDVMFAILLGALNSLIFPVLKMSGKVSALKIGGLALAINCIAYALLKIVPLGIHLMTIEGYCAAALLTTIGSFLFNFLEMKQSKSPPPQAGEHQLPL